MTNIPALIDSIDRATDDFFAKENGAILVKREDAIALVSEYRKRSISGVAPLAWVVWCDGWQAHTPFGSYTVEPNSRASGWLWRYCFDEVYDEDSFSCDDADEGKSLAWAHWLDRVSPVVAKRPVPAHDIADQLRYWAENDVLEIGRREPHMFDVHDAEKWAGLMEQGADEIDRLREALKPFAALATEFMDDSDIPSKADDRTVWGFNEHDLTYGDFRRALSTLRALQAKTGDRTE